MQVAVLQPRTRPCLVTDAKHPWSAALLRRFVFLQESRRDLRIGDGGVRFLASKKVLAGVSRIKSDSLLVGTDKKTGTGSVPVIYINQKTQISYQISFNTVSTMPYLAASSADIK